MTRKPLNRERVLRAALAVVDDEGVEALSMRRVADALGVEAMSLYNHVDSKGAMLDGVVEIVLGELAPPKRTTSWKTALRDRALALRDTLRAHPNALSLFASRPALTPASLPHVDDALALLGKAGVDAIAAFHLLVALVVGHTLLAQAIAKPPPGYRPLHERDIDRELEMGIRALLDGFAPR